MTRLPDVAGTRLGPFWFSPGWSRGQAATVWVASLLTVGLTAFMAFVQPYLLNEMLHVPASEQGTLTGTLGALQELLVIGAAGFAGAWSDRVGRRPVYCAGFVCLAVGYVVYVTASTVPELYLYRLVFAAGVALAPLMLSACVVDATQEVSRGRWVGSNNLLQGLGVATMGVVLSRVPAWFAGHGSPPSVAGRYAYWTAAGLCLVAALVVALGLPRGAPARAIAAGGVRRQLASAALEVAGNRRLALAHGAAFIGRGDFTIIGNFFTLWVVQAGIERGMPTATALARAGMLFGLVQASAMGWAFFMGLIVDRLDRVTALCAALTMATAGYLLVGQAHDPFARDFLPLAVFLGMAEVSVIVTGGALLGQEARPEVRGPLLGLYNAVGGIGILFATFVGGLVFDQAGRTAPFTLIGALNGALLAWGLAVRWRGRTTG